MALCQISSKRNFLLKVNLLYDAAILENSSSLQIKVKRPIDLKQCCKEFDESFTRLRLQESNSLA